METLIANLMDELKSYIKAERTADGFPNDTPLDDGQSVEIVASTYSQNLLIYIWEVATTGEPVRYISSEHGDGGVTVFSGGPWESLDNAQAFFGDCSEGWATY